MEFTVRAASGTHDYPLPIDHSLSWQDNTARLEIGHVPEGHIIIPSFSQLPDQGRLPSFSFTLTAADHHPVQLQRVPAKNKNDCSRGGSDESISTHIDCFHTHRPQEEVTISVELDEPPLQSSLMVVSIRPLQMEVALPTQSNIRLEPPEAISQMSAPKDIRQRICSPTATAMCLSTYQNIGDWLTIVDKCADPLSRAFGVWPLAIRAANGFGVHGAVEALVTWDAAYEALHSGHPIVCSINFAKGELTGAPLTQTSGHLVVLYGFDEKHAYVMDPAADSGERVQRRYDLSEFSQAWLHERGAAYIFSGHAHTLSH